VIGTLFIVGTPIGNLEDLSLRAARILREADVVAAEDTRSARRLLAHVDALGPSNRDRKVVSNFEGNEAERAGDIANALCGGLRVAVISEAGMPGVSDPGRTRRTRRSPAGASRSSRTIADARRAVASGTLPTDRFRSSGFRRARPARARRCSARCATRPRR
jgi:16S rRNA (cytidine1402-2'-O)-methyltransferase